MKFAATITDLAVSTEGILTQDAYQGYKESNLS